MRAEKCGKNSLSETGQNGISDSDYCGNFNSYYYDSIEELYQGLRDFDSMENPIF
jgi:hypothetical protein